MITALMAVAAVVSAAHAKTLIVYYSFTNNVKAIAEDLYSQIPDADIVRIEPAEEDIDYAANNYAVGDELIKRINDNPDDAASYPEIKPVDADLSLYSEVFIAVPLWWSHAAAPMQTYLFHHGAEMSGKHIGLIVSSASSGVSGVEADVHRLVPDGNFLTPTLWIRSSQTGNCHSLTAQWLLDIGYADIASRVELADADSEPVAYYDLQGRAVLQMPQSGIYIARYGDGRSRKVAVR